MRIGADRTLYNNYNTAKNELAPKLYIIDSSLNFHITSLKKWIMLFLKA